MLVILFVPYVQHQVLGNLEHRWGLTLSVKNISLTSLSELTASDIWIQNPNGPLTAHIRKAVISINLFGAFTGSPPFAFSADGVSIRRHLNHPQIPVVDVLDSRAISTFGPDEIYQSALSFLRTASRLPSFIRLSNLSFRQSSASFRSAITIRAVTIADKLTSQFNLSMRRAVLQIFQKPLLPKPLRSRLGSGYLQVRRSSGNDENIVMKSSAGFTHLLLSNPRLSSKMVNVNSGHAFITLRAEPDKFSVEPDSRFSINGVPFFAQATLSRMEDTPLRVELILPVTPAQNVIDALTDGILVNLAGLQTSGDISYHLVFAANLQSFKNLSFDSDLRSRNLKINHYGKADLGKLAGNFQHQVLGNDNLPITIQLSEDDPAFIPLRKISPSLVNAVLATEDRAFYRHKGFSKHMVARALQKNLEAGSFKVGASTITMQLVKNLFLNPERTISRKAEESILVWLIENLGLVSKDRILEIYLNVIEWGPGIYGIGPAAKYYFQKKPEALTAFESVQLASIISSPKKGLVPGNVNKIKAIAGFLWKNGLITREELQAFIPQIQSELTQSPALVTGVGR